ncbi:MAG: extracellular solute-binding protein [Chloroflexi bacterium]|nr:MAG: extracellular solute-binding protein [Chloroflexota bacterium]
MADINRPPTDLRASSLMILKRKLGHFLTGSWSLILLAFGTTAVACQADLTNPPRLATATARAQLTAPTPNETRYLPAPTATPNPVPASTQTPPPVGQLPGLTVWVNETSPEHEAVLQTMTADLAQAGINVEFVMVSPMLLPKLVNTAVLSDTLPDIILHPLEFTIGWAERGILNPNAATAALEAIGRNTFNPDALELVTVNGQVAALPIDGFHRLLLYRTDWFNERGLLPPDNYEAMLTAAETIYNREQLVTGFVIPTESNLVTTQQSFEHIATANGCQLVDTKGEILILEPACREALDFYFTIIHNYSPPGVQTDISARNAFLDGRTGMIMASPRILPQLAGLDEKRLPACPECIETADFLVNNTGILTHIRGNSTLASPTAFSEITYLGITSKADPETAVTFARYWFNEGYEAWLAVEPERKVPMRWGTAESPRRFIDNWGTQPIAQSNQSLTDIYGPQLVQQLREDIVTPTRWGYAQKHGELITVLYEELTFSIVLQEMLSGYFTPDQTLIETYLRVTDLIPNYQYYIELEPTPTPQP